MAQSLNDRHSMAVEAMRRAAASIAARLGVAAPCLRPVDAGDLLHDRKREVLLLEHLAEMWNTLAEEKKSPLVAPRGEHERKTS